MFSQIAILCMDSQRKSISLSTATSQQPEKGLNEKNSDDLSLPGLLKKENCNAIHIDSIDEESLELSITIYLSLFNSAFFRKPIV